MLKSRLIILEGPAGAGKSTVAHALQEQYPEEIQLVQKSIVTGDKRKDLRDDELDWMSWQNDLAKTTTAIGHMYESPQVVIVDRLVFSQVVYGGLRIDTLPGKGYGSQGLASWFNLYNSLWRDLCFRDYSSLPLSLPEFRILYVNPGLEQLTEQRGDGRGYGFAVEDEFNAYELVMRDIQAPVFRFNNLGVNDVESVLFR